MRFLSQHPTLTVILDHGDYVNDTATGIMDIKRPILRIIFKGGRYETDDRTIVLAIAQYVVSAAKKGFKPTFSVHPEDAALFNTIVNDVRTTLHVPRQPEAIPEKIGSPEPVSASSGAAGVGLDLGIVMGAVQSLAVTVEALKTKIGKESPKPAKVKGKPGRPKKNPVPGFSSEDDWEGTGKGKGMSALEYRKREEAKLAATRAENRNVMDPEENQETTAPEAAPPAAPAEAAPAVAPAEEAAPVAA